ncbi:methyltransferase domain-containing protein [Thauera mechernichensis]|uniref:Methyltransferase domain-containing protein n=1 Tax=Thauera mechernichensis TaxID=82788 RepID=A0ABW3WG52_9RHOO|nr:methyltransferase domain-containing protein [Thauera mechernichensis]MDG3064103.1 methyltransferase domain-containing protein [Thauera mechernichensis]
MDLTETTVSLDRIEQHWYYQSKAKAVTSFIDTVNSKVVLDVGAGSGFFSTHLLNNSSIREAWCVDINYEKEIDSLTNDKPQHFRKKIDSIDADTVLLMDVLEHVEDDIGLLREYVKKVPPGAKFLISVPAFNFLWSDHDVFLGHKRRYTLNGLESVIARSGLQVKRSAYFFGAVFPIAAVTRLSQRHFKYPKRAPKSQLVEHRPIVNATLKALCNLEISVMNFNRLFGLTAFCLAE